MESRLNAILEDKGHRVESVLPECSVFDCAKKMSGLGIGSLLVIKDGKLLGIVSERDIIRKFIQCNCEISQFQVQDIMTTNVITVTPHTTVTEAMRIVTEKRFRHLPVIENEELKGIVSIGDLTRWAMLAQENEISSLTKYIHGDKLT